MVTAMTDYERRIYELGQRLAQPHDRRGSPQTAQGGLPLRFLATVYNNLNKLWGLKLIRKVSVPGSPDRYDRVARHDHLVCRGCGKLTDICFSDLTPALQAPDRRRDPLLRPQSHLSLPRMPPKGEGGGQALNQRAAC